MPGFHVGEKVELVMGGVFATFGDRGEYQGGLQFYPGRTGTVEKREESTLIVRLDPAGHSSEARVRVFPGNLRSQDRPRS